MSSSSSTRPNKHGEQTEELDGGGNKLFHRNPNKTRRGSIFLEVNRKQEVHLFFSYTFAGSGRVTFCACQKNNTIGFSWGHANAGSTWISLLEVHVYRSNQIHLIRSISIRLRRTTHVNRTCFIMDRTWRENEQIC